MSFRISTTAPSAFGTFTSLFQDITFTTPRAELRPEGEQRPQFAVGAGGCVRQYILFRFSATIGNLVNCPWDSVPGTPDNASNANLPSSSSDSAKRLPHFLSDSISSRSYLARAFCSISGSFDAPANAFSSIVVMMEHLSGSFCTLRQPHPADCWRPARVSRGRPASGRAGALVSRIYRSLFKESLFFPNLDLANSMNSCFINEMFPTLR